MKIIQRNSKMFSKQLKTCKNILNSFYNYSKIKNVTFIKHNHIKTRSKDRLYLIYMYSYRNDPFVIGKQEDSHELLNTLLVGIFDEIKTLIVSLSFKYICFSFNKINS